MYVVPKSVHGLNKKYKNPDLSFARKSLPFGFLSSHFEKGGLLAIHHTLGLRDGHTDQVPKTTRPSKKQTFPCSVHNINIQYESVADVIPFVVCCLPPSILTGVDGFQSGDLSLVPIGAGCPFGCYTLIC